MKKLINILLLLALALTLSPAAAWAQEEVTCQSDVVVQDDDWLSKLAEKFLGDVLAFPAIVEATNAKAATDDSYATIENADVIEVGWKLCIPSPEDAQALMGQAAAPSAASTNGEEQTLVVWDIEVGAYGEVLNQINASFEAAHPGVKIQRTTYTLDDIMNTLPLAMAQPDGPDVAQVNQGQTNMGRLVEAGLLLPLDDYATKYGWRQIFSEGLLARNSFTPDGQTFGEGNLWGVSVSAEIVGVFYNKKIFADNGVEVPKTFDEFQAALQTFKDKGVVPLALGAAGDGVPAIHDFSAVQHLLISRQYLDDFIYGRNNVSFDTPENQEAAAIVQEWAKNSYFTPSFEGISGADMAKLFATGQAAMMISGNWWSGDIIAANEPGTIGFFTLPPVEGKPAMAIGGLGVPFAINKSTKNPDLAAEYINWLVSRDAANQIAGVGQLTAAPLGAVEIDPLLQEISTAFEQNNKNNTIGHYIDWAAPTLFDELGAASQELVAQRITPQEFTARIQKVYGDYLATRE